MLDQRTGIAFANDRGACGKEAPIGVAHRVNIIFVVSGRI